MSHSTMQSQLQIVLSEYTDTLSSLPNELTRTFSDLRELDAVLRSSIESITQKITRLTELLEDPSTSSPSEKLVLLLEIADDAQRLKMGSEDKIRVAGKACEELIHTRTHTLSLLSPFFPLSTLSPLETTYPHVSPASLIPPNPIELNGRRKRIPTAVVQTISSASGGAGAGGRGGGEGTPVKRRKVVEGGEGGGDKAVGSNSMVAHGKTGNGTSTTATAGTKVSKDSREVVRKPRNTAHHTPPHHKSPTPSTSHLPQNATKPSATSNTNTSAAANAQPSRTTSSLLDVVASRPTAFEEDDYEYSSSLPLSRTRRPNANSNAANKSSPTSGPGNTSGEMELEDGEEEGEGEGEVDTRTYCYCNRQSFGEMIACDEPGCEKEWFHLQCLGLTTPPEGKWYCKPCRAARGHNTRKKD